MKKVLKIKKSDIIGLISNGVTKNSKSPYYDSTKGTLKGILNCRQEAIVSLFKNNPDLESHYKKTFKPVDSRVEILELED